MKEWQTSQRSLAKGDTTCSEDGVNFRFLIVIISKHAVFGHLIQRLKIPFCRKMRVIVGRRVFISGQRLEEALRLAIMIYAGEGKTSR